jgi:ADP-glucose pyrophosphorylase
MPNAGTYRLSDFPLSNYVNSGISDAWILRQYEPQSPDEHIANGRPWDLDRTVFAFRPSALLDALERDDRGSNGPGDLGGSELPTSDAYWSAHMELAGGDAGIRLDDPGFPVLSHGSIRTPVFVEGSAEIDPAFLSPGCRVAGRVQRAVLGPGVVVEDGAQVRDCVILDDVRIAAGARLTTAIIDAGVTIAGGANGRRCER